MADLNETLVSEVDALQSEDLQEKLDMVSSNRDSLLEMKSNMLTTEDRD